MKLYMEPKVIKKQIFNSLQDSMEDNMAMSMKKTTTTKRHYTKDMYKYLKVSSAIPQSNEYTSKLVCFHRDYICATVKKRPFQSHLHQFSTLCSRSPQFNLNAMNIH